MTLVQPPIFVGVLAFVAVATLTAVMRRVAIWRRLVADPRPGRIHTSATPYLGGVAIVIGSIGAIAAIAYPRTAQVLAVIIAALAVSVLGLIDDLWTLSPAIRLIVESAAAAGLVATGVHVDAFAGMPVVGPWIDDVGTVVWIVIITNSFNLLDNTDGVAAAVAFVTSPVLAVLAFRVGQADLAVLLIALCAGCAGFLVHNWTPARIFMGDGLAVHWLRDLRRCCADMRFRQHRARANCRDRKRAASHDIRGCSRYLHGHGLPTAHRAPVVRRGD